MAVAEQTAVDAADDRVNNVDETSSTDVGLQRRQKWHKAAIYYTR